MIQNVIKSILIHQIFTIKKLKPIIEFELSYKIKYIIIKTL